MKGYRPGECPQRCKQARVSHSAQLWDTLRCSIGAAGLALAASVRRVRRRTRSGDADREGCGVAAYVLIDRDATLSKVEELLAVPKVRAADLVAFPESLLAQDADLDRRGTRLGRRRAVVCEAGRRGRRVPSVATERATATPRTRRSSAASFAERDGSATNLRRRRDAQQLEPRKGVAWQGEGGRTATRCSYAAPRQARSSPPRRRGLRHVVIHTGPVETSRGQGADRTVLATLRQGDFFGETSLLESLPREADATAVPQTSLPRDHRGRPPGPPVRGPDFAIETLDRLSGRVRSLSRQMEETDRRDPRHRRGAALRGVGPAPRKPGVTCTAGGSCCSLTMSRIISGATASTATASTCSRPASPVSSARRRRCSRELETITAVGGHVYYVVGTTTSCSSTSSSNVLTFELSPFLNLHPVGSTRIRIQHGHLSTRSSLGNLRL